MARISILVIRKAINACNHSRHWVTGGTNEEFRRQDVERVLLDRIDTLLALRVHIPANKPDDLHDLDYAVLRARETIARWHALRLLEAVRIKALAA